MIETTIENRFRLKERVLQQGELDIYDGVDQTVGQSVWVKIWNAPLSQDVEFGENWRGQLISLQGIDDGHLPRIIAFGRTTTGALYQVEEPPTGTLMRRFVSRRAPLDVEATIKVITSVAEAVAVAHREGMAHGSLNPENIYLEEDADGNLDAYVTHWELGEAVVAMRHAGEIIPDRAARYLAPEQTNEASRPTPPTPTTDVYALGAMLYELLTGTLPTAPDEKIAAAPTVTPPRRFNPDIPGGVENLMLRALSLDPALRQPNAHSFASGLLQALHNPEPIPIAPTPTVAVVVPRRAFPWRTLALFSLGALLAVVAIVAWLNWSDNRNGAVVVTPLPDTIPTLRNLPYNQAIQTAWAQGYTVTINKIMDDPNLPSGIIVEQCPRPQAPRNTDISNCQLPNLPPLEQGTILVDISSLPAPQVLRLVPDLYGQGEDAARTALEEGGLRVGTRRTAYDLFLPIGRIVEQNPRRSVAVPAGTTVDIIVSAGPPAGTEGAPPPQTPSTDTVPTLTVPPVAPPDTSLTNPTTSQDVGRATQTPPTAPIPVQTGALLLDEPFEGNSALSWAQDDTTQYMGVIRNGVYEIQMKEAGQFFKSQPNSLFDDFRLSATVVLSNTSDSESGAGVIFRATSAQAFYYFEINGNQAWRVRAQSAGIWQTVYDWTASTALRPASFENNLTVEAEGERFTLYINGEQVGSSDLLPGALYTTGDVGVAASSGKAPITATFDNLQVGRLR